VYDGKLVLAEGYMGRWGISDAVKKGGTFAPPFVDQVLPVAIAVPPAAEAAFRLLGLADVTTGLAPDRLAEPAGLEELLFTSGEREGLAAVLAG